MNKIIEHFEHFSGEKGINMELLPMSGSNRKYYRVTGERTTLIATVGTCVEENRAFCYMAEHFREKGLNVPSLRWRNEDCSIYFQEDLGDLSLFDAIAEGRKKGEYSEAERGLLVRTIRELPRIQFEGAQDFDFSRCYPQQELDRRSVHFDLNYFKYCFLKPSGLEFNESLLEDDFESLTDDLLSVKSSSFLYRDFQARNVMLKEGIPYFIDFQGGRRGPFYYDLASFVWQARACYPQDLKDELISVYREKLSEYIVVGKEEFFDILEKFVLFRMLQVLGAYGFRGYFEGKPHFIESVPFALDNLREIMAHHLPRYNYLSELLKRLIEMKRTDRKSSVEEKLCVRIFSFGYKYGIPKDESGNGGGYVFDCRGMHNPGRYEEYKKKTGMDREVKDFLEERGEVQKFMSDVFRLADRHIETYLRRGFTHLMFSFGCTGGQHRSVYCAEALARHISDKYAIKVCLTHREQGVYREF